MPVNSSSNFQAATPFSMLNLREVDGFSVPKSLSASFISKVDATVVKHCVVANAVRQILTAFDALKYWLGARGRGSLPAAPLPTRIKGGRDSIDGVDVFPFSPISRQHEELGSSTAELGRLANLLSAEKAVHLSRAFLL